MEAVLAPLTLLLLVGSWLILLMALWSLHTLSRQAKRHAAQLQALDRRLRLVMDHLGIVERPPALPAAVLHHLEAGRKLQAIKEYRAATGVSLKEAKDAVEAAAPPVIR